MAENRTKWKTQQWSFGNSYVCSVLITDHLQLTVEGTSAVNCCRFFKISAVNCRRGFSSFTCVFQP